MDTFDRRSEIIRHLRQRQRASTRALSDMFQVSEVTIRHDLTNLEQQGWLTRVHGGAEITPQLQGEQSFALRQTLHAEEKINIAQAAARLVQSGDTIILDSSTTAFQLALQLTESTDLRVMTNNLHIVAMLSTCAGIEVVLVGGVVRNETASVVGPPAEEMLAWFNADKAFFGAAGLTIERGLVDADLREAQVKRAMVKAAGQVNVLLDSSKFGQRAFATFASLAEVDQLFTDEKIPADYRQTCQDAGISLTVV
jgi:DeoR/GlpR family transcriptional regulator of sugar metabolism